jgi:hypothetical protein
MNRWISIVLGSVMTMVLMVLAMWIWEHAASLTDTWATRRPVATLAIWSGAVGLIAAAQLILLVFVIERIYRRDLFGELLKLTAGLICTVASVGAIALGFASR